MATQNKMRNFLSQRVYELRRKVRDGQLDYPSIMVACSYTNIDTVFAEKSAAPINYVFHPQLQRAITSVGIIGQSTRYSDNRLGSCAEQRAANKAIKRYHHSIGVLDFTPAIRPRTMQIKPYCENCKRIFPQL